MKKNAFTLVELLGVIIILTIIALITVPLITSTVQNSQKKAENAQSQLFEKAAQEYVSEHLYTDCKNICEINLSTLQKEGYLDPGKINTSETDKCYNLEGTIVTATYKEEKNGYDYTLKISTNNCN